MSIDQNKAIVRRLITEVLAGGNSSRWRTTSSTATGENPDSCRESKSDLSAPTRTRIIACTGSRLHSIAIECSVWGRQRRPL
jgi:hypothetical protein